jgi:outer membrane protein
MAGSITRKTFSIFVAGCVFLCMFAAIGYSQAGKMGYVDLRRAFYEYNKSKTLEAELTELTNATQDKRNTMIQNITRLRDETEILKGAAKEKKQSEIDNMLKELQQFDAETREIILNKRNDMFRQVVDDIQKVVEGIGKKQGYDYILDSRNIMYADERSDLTQDVIDQLNK